MGKERSSLNTQFQIFKGNQQGGTFLISHLLRSLVALDKLQVYTEFLDIWGTEREWGIWRGKEEAQEIEANTKAKSSDRVIGQRSLHPRTQVWPGWTFGTHHMELVPPLAFWPTVSVDKRVLGGVAGSWWGKGSVCGEVQLSFLPKAGRHSLGLPVQHAQGLPRGTMTSESHWRLCWGQGACPGQRFYQPQLQSFNSLSKIS